jgi:hypothetical protein
MPKRQEVCFYASGIIICAWYVQPLTRGAHMVRAILFANATAATQPHTSRREYRHFLISFSLVPRVAIAS